MGKRLVLEVERFRLRMLLFKIGWYKIVVDSRVVMGFYVLGRFVLLGIERWVFFVSFIFVVVCYLLVMRLIFVY